MSSRETRPPTRPTQGQCCPRYRWCVRETTTTAGDGSPARFHHGVPTTVQGGDDAVTVALLATDDTDTVYIEIEASDLGPVTGTVWLTNDEARKLADTLVATTAVARCPSSGSGLY